MHPVPDFITRTAQDCGAWGVPYCSHELQACSLAFNRLLTVAGPVKARLLFDALVTESLNRLSPEDQKSPWGGLVTELDFETTVARLDNRRRVAVEALAQTGQPDDAALDLFNDRMGRP